MINLSSHSMQDKLAIIILGRPNSGKTTTLKHFCNTYHHKTVTAFKLGWRWGLTPWKPKYNGVKIDAYFLPASRTERGEYLKDNIEAIGWNPEFIFMAEQLNGSKYSDTINFLRKHNYHIKEFTLHNVLGPSIWNHYDIADEKLFLTHRTEEIADYVRSFIVSRI